MTVSIPINCVDCIRIYFKIKELEQDAKEDGTLWCPIHQLTVDLNEMKVILDSNPN